jgi:hypothetical protein
LDELDKEAFIDLIERAKRYVEVGMKIKSPEPVRISCDVYPCRASKRTPTITRNLFSESSKNLPQV